MIFKCIIKFKYILKIKINTVSVFDLCFVLSGLCSPSWGSYWSILWWSPAALPSSGGCASTALLSLAALLPPVFNCSLWTFTHHYTQFTDWDSFKIDLQARWPSLIAQRLSSFALRRLLCLERLSIWQTESKKNKKQISQKMHLCAQLSVKGVQLFSVH